MIDPDLRNLARLVGRALAPQWIAEQKQKRRGKKHDPKQDPPKTPKARHPRPAE